MLQRDLLSYILEKLGTLLWLLQLCWKILMFFDCPAIDTSANNADLEDELVAPNTTKRCQHPP